MRLFLKTDSVKKGGIYLLWALSSVIGFNSKTIYASECEAPRNFYFESRPQHFCWIRLPSKSKNPTGAWISKGCLDTPKKCGAIQLVESASIRKTKLSAQELRGGKNPSNLICKKLGGKIALATMESGSQATFCEATDKSLIDCNALEQVTP